MIWPGKEWVTIGRICFPCPINLMMGSPGKEFVCCMAISRPLLIGFFIAVEIVLKYNSQNLHYSTSDQYVTNFGHGLYIVCIGDLAQTC